MNYKLYRTEREHDKLLIQLVKDLCRKDRLDLVENAFDVNIQGKLFNAKRRHPFDVELTFENLSIVIETKVDSDESWTKGKERGNSEWQTQTIVKVCDNLRDIKEDKHYRFITYGTSEFYTKNCKAGPASSEFQHVGLDKMVALVNESEKIFSPPTERTNWLKLMKIEQEKRKNANKLLQSYSRFRKEYLEIHQENDFPRNRFLFCAPELAFPVLFSLLEEWEKSNFVNKFGKLELYPVGRGSPNIHDSILNFFEMWQGEVKGLGEMYSPDGKVELYIEINEDFNLNLKTWQKLNESIKMDIWSRLKDGFSPSFPHHQRRDYKQGPFVLYEVDFGFLDNLDDMKQVTTNLGQTVESIVRALSKGSR